MALLFYANVTYWHGDPAWGPADQRLVDGFERACLHGGLDPAAH